MIDLTRFDHVAFAVRDLAAAARLYGDALGGQLVRGGDDTDIGIRTLQFKYPPGVKVELLEPIGDSYLARHLDRHGEGFHHVTVFVEDLESAIEELRGRGFDLIDIELVLDTWKEAFLRPRATFGSLIQLVSTSLDDWGEPVEGMTVDSVLNGDWRWINNRCVPRSEVERLGLRNIRPPKAFANRRSPK